MGSQTETAGGSKWPSIEAAGSERTPDWKVALHPGAGQFDVRASNEFDDPSKLARSSAPPEGRLS